MTKDSDKTSARQIDHFLNSMNVIFYLGVCVPLLFFIPIFLSFQEKGGISPSFESTDPFWHPLLALIALLLSLPGYFTYKQQLKNIAAQAPLLVKLEAFKQAAIKKYLFIFLGSCVAVLCLYVFAEQIFLMAYGLLLIMFSISRPTPYRIKKDVPLSKEERVTLTEYRKYL